MNNEQAILDELRGLRADLRALTGAAFSKERAAEFLDVSVRTLDNLIAQGRVHPVNNSPNPEEGKRGRVTFSRTELERYLREQ
jgi:hypothetical protein